MRVSWRVVAVLPSALVGVVVAPLAGVFVVVVLANVLASVCAALLLVSRFMVFMGRVSFSVWVCGFVVVRGCVCCLRA